MSASTSLTRPQIRVDVPRKLSPLLQPARYKGAYGGRGGAKSHFFAEQIIVRCYAQPKRVVCIREVQNSIKDSVKQLLTDKITKLGLEKHFTILDTEIRGANGSLIIFRGMQSYNSDTIKSLEGYDIAWIEEAQTLSEVSLDLLRPTIRKPGSEIWASWNPRHRTDPIDVFFRKRPHPDAVSVMVNWRDNPWFPEILRKDMEADKAADPDKAEHVWEGGYGLQAGAILGRWVSAAEKECRIHNDVEYDPDGAPIEISSDIGYRDTSSWWFWQRKVGGFSLIDYDEGNGLEAQEWIQRLQDRIQSGGYKLGKIWLPPDAKSKTFQSRYTSAEQFLTAFGGAKHVGVLAASKKADQINAARTVIKKCEFHEERCERGLDGLRAWAFKWDPDLQIFRKEPDHTWASHPSDAYAYGCQIMQTVKPIEPNKAGRILQIGDNPPENQVTLEDLWAHNERKRRRRA